MGSSERSSWANALTPAAPVLTPAQPTGLTADPAHDQVGLDWDDPDDSGDHRLPHPAPTAGPGPAG